ncbi:MAG: recombinase family protein [Candidatus Limnocylindria bacterium]
MEARGSTDPTVRNIARDERRGLKLQALGDQVFAALLDRYRGDPETAAGGRAAPHTHDRADRGGRNPRHLRPAAGSGKRVSHGAIAAELDTRGVTRRGRAWSKQSVRDIIRRGPFYAGSAVYRRDVDVRRGLHDPIISLEQLQLAQRTARRQPFATGRSVAPHRVWPLQLIAYCAACGRRMWSETSIRGGREYRYYRCSGRLDRACSAPSAPADPVETHVIEHIASHASPPELMAAMRAELARMRHLPGEELRGQRARLEARRARLNEQYERGTIDAATFRAKWSELEGQLAELPPAADSNVIAFDRAAARLLPDGTHPPRDDARPPGRADRSHRAACGHRRRPSVSIEVRPEARPFFASLEDKRPRRESNPRRRP